VGTSWYEKVKEFKSPVRVVAAVLLRSRETQNARICELNSRSNLPRCSTAGRRSRPVLQAKFAEMIQEEPGEQTDAHAEFQDVDFTDVCVRIVEQACENEFGRLGGEVPVVVNGERHGNGVGYKRTGPALLEVLLAEFPLDALRQGAEILDHGLPRLSAPQYVRGRPVRAPPRRPQGLRGSFCFRERHVELEPQFNLTLPGIISILNQASVPSGMPLAATLDSVGDPSILRPIGDKGPRGHGLPYSLR